MKTESKIICALDLQNIKEIIKLVTNINFDIIFKFGMEFFYNFGIDGIHEIKKIKPNIKIFLDLKLHDIPNTVSKSIIPLLKNIEPKILTIHVAGGRIMMEEAVKVIEKTSKELRIQRPLLMGVTILTSLSQENLDEMGHYGKVNDYVLNYASLAKKSGLDGVVCSALETKKIKNELGNDFKIITPGIRISDSKNDDQSRVVTPQQAFENGSDYIVIGRNLIYAKDPNKVINDII